MKGAQALPCKTVMHHRKIKIFYQLKNITISLHMFYFSHDTKTKI